MATDYTLNLKAELDTSDAEAKLAKLQSGGSMGGGQGGSTLQPLEKSIEKLNNTLTSMNKDGSFQMKSVMRMFAGRYIGSTLRKAADSQIDAGNTGVGVALGGFGGAMKGAMSMSFLGPWGMAAGAAFGGLNSSLDLLGKTAEKTKNKILEQARVQQEQIKTFHQAQDEMKRQRRKDEYAALSDEELLKIVSAAKSVKAQLEDFLTPQTEGGPETAGARFAKRMRGNGQEEDYVAARDKELKRLQKQVAETGFNAAVAQTLLEERGMESIYGSKSEFGKSKALTGLLAPTSTLAQKGYDVGGYGGFASIEQQALQEQRRTAENTKEVVQETKKLTLVSQNLYTYLVNRDMVSARRLEDKWH